MCEAEQFTYFFFLTKYELTKNFYLYIYICKICSFEDCVSSKLKFREMLLGVYVITSGL